MPRPENHEKPKLPVPCRAIRAENLQLLTRRGLLAGEVAALIRPGRWLRVGRRTVVPDLPDLHIAWCAAIGAGLLTVAGGKAAGGPALGDWPPDDTGLLEAWLKGFFAVSVGVSGGQRDMGRGFLVLVLALLTVLRDEGVPAARGLLREVLEEAEEICDDRDLDIDVYDALSSLSPRGVRRLDGLTAVLAGFGMAAG